MKIFEQLRERFFPPFRPLPAGMYQYLSRSEDGFPYRLQLRVEPDGRGVLILNGSTVLHLNQTAAEYIYHFTAGTDPQTVAKTVSTRYGISRAQASEDFTDLVEKLKTLAETQDLDPVTLLDFDQADLYSGAIAAPYRIDCALTYQIPEGQSAVFAPVDRVKRELVETEWQTILKKAWGAGIPHVVFTGGEPTMRPDLLGLLRYASNLGMVTGLISQGLRLSDPGYLQDMLQTGLDHLMLILNPQEEESWEALRDVLVEDLSVTVHLTLSSHSPIDHTQVIERLHAMGVNRLSISAPDESLASALADARQLAAERSIKLVFDLPVPYSQFHPLSLELSGAEKPPQGAGSAWVYVEPDGDVLCGQGDPRVLGNLLSGSWNEIWQNR